MAAVEIVERWLDAGGIRTRYLEAGAGEPIVFIHGGYAGDPALAESADGWAIALRDMGRGFRCIAPDRLGQGCTANPENDAGYAMSAAVAHIIAFLEALGGSAHLVGHGHGGYVAAAVTLEAPARVRSCTILSSELVCPGGGAELVLAGNPHAPFSRESARFVLEKITLRHEHITPDLLDRIAAIFASPKYRAAAAKMADDGLYDTLYLPRLRADRDRVFARLAQAGILRPVALIWGRDDPVAGLDLAYAAFGAFARHELRCELHVVNGAGHYAFRERPDTVHRMIANFVENVRHGV